MDNKFFLLMIFILYLCYNKNKEKFSQRQDNSSTPSDEVDMSIPSGSFLLLENDKDYGYDIVIGRGYSFNDPVKINMALYIINENDGKKFNFTKDSDGKYMQPFTYSKEGLYYKSDTQNLYIYFSSTQGKGYDGGYASYINASVYKNKAPEQGKDESMSDFGPRYQSWLDNDLVYSNLKFVHTKDIQ